MRQTSIWVGGFVGDILIASFVPRRCEMSSKFDGGPREGSAKVRKQMREFNGGE